MTTLDFFTIHAETELGYVRTEIKINFKPNDSYVTELICKDVIVENWTELYDCLTLIYEKDVFCTYTISQADNDLYHKINIKCNVDEISNIEFFCEDVSVKDVIID